MTDISNFTEEQFNAAVEKKAKAYVKLSSHRFSKAKATSLAKCDLLYPLEGWTNTVERGDFKAYKLQIKGMPYPFVRGDTIYPGESIAKIVGALLSPGRRKMWDKRSDKIITIEYLNDGSSLIQAQQKGQMMVSPRWLNLYSFESREKDTLYCTTESVEDPAFPAVPSSAVKGMSLTSWRLIQTPSGVKVTRIAYVDPKGSLPSALFKTVLADLTESVNLVQDFLKKNGPICATLLHKPYASENVQFVTREFSLDTITLAMKVVPKGSPTKGSPTRTSSPTRSSGEGSPTKKSRISKDTSGKVWFCVPAAYKSKFAITTQGDVEVSLVPKHDCGDMIVFEVTINGMELCNVEGKVGKALSVNGIAL